MSEDQVPDAVGAQTADIVMDVHVAGEPDTQLAITQAAVWSADYPDAFGEALLDVLPLIDGALGQLLSLWAPAGQTPGAERLTVTVEEAAELLGISRAFAYEAVRRGEIPSLRIGARILVPKAALLKMLEVEPTTQKGNAGTNS